MRLKVHLISQSKPVEHIEVINTYIKSGMYCILLPNEEVYKYPMINIFRVIEN